MLSTNTAKYINSLKIKKYRQLHQAFIVEGEKSVAELLTGNLKILGIYGLEEWVQENRKLLQQCSSPVVTISETELRKISDLVTPNKVLATVSLPQSLSSESPDYGDMILALDGIRDPGNMGTIIRTADWFGINQVICSPDSVDVFNPKVIQATMGSYARVRISCLQLDKLINMAPKGTPVFGALLEGPAITDKKFIKPGILIIGNESKGISESLIPYITDPVFIPSYPAINQGSSHAESLNASVANAIICYEIRKQLFQNKS